MSNSKFYNALNRIPQATPPIWFMRQAGRYHSHYQKLKAKYSFEELCKEPELAAEVACGPVEEFDFDVSILFSDILFILEALGLELKFNPGPQFKEHLTFENYERLNNIENVEEHMQFQQRAIKITREKLSKDKSLIGFVGGFWTVMRFAIGQNKEQKQFQKFYPEYIKNILYEALKINIKLQLDAGAEIVMMFDSGIQDLDNNFFQKEYTNLLTNIANLYPNKIGYYVRGKQFSDIKHLLELPFAGVGIDSSMNLKNLFTDFKHGFIQGNFDEKKLLLDTQHLTEELDKFSDNCNGFENLNGWVCGLGHGISKNTPEKNVHLFIETIRKKFK